MSLEVDKAKTLYRHRYGLVCLITLLGSFFAGGSSRGDSLSSQTPINYETATPDDAIARLQKRIDAGQTELEYSERHGYLPAVLKSLGIPESSQSLVFSKTSFQRERISPWAPRALYFNSDVYIGWVKGGDVLEVASIDKQLGPVFYTLFQQKVQKPQFRRQTDSCIQCHESSMTQEVPGLVMRSVTPDAGGMPIFTAGNYRTTIASPFAQRWGGWYVTGTHGAQRHMGNLVVHQYEDPEHPDLEPGANLLQLDKQFNPSSYLAPGSDIVALMVLTHQAQVHNYLTRANYESRLALRDEQVMNEALGEASHVRESTPRRIKAACEPLVRAMLFSGELPLTDPIVGSSSFTRDFPAVGPRDKAGRSLREFDLNTRMFKYPCSYLIYTESFAALPARAKDYIYERLWEIVSGKDASASFANLSAKDRQAIREILADTMKDLPGYWK